MAITLMRMVLATQYKNKHSSLLFCLFWRRRGGNYLHKSKETSSSDQILWEVLRSRLAVSQWVDSDKASVTDTFIRLSVVTVVCSQVTHEEDIVPSCPKTTFELNKVVFIGELDGVPPLYIRS
jgi:hypothetical protein